jgi:PTH1 family peptidyl-tRNA hydrolase
VSIGLLVGLGNPGPEYDATRHNAGFWFVTQFARDHGMGLHLERKFHGHYGRTGGLHMLLPNTYMNRSGIAVSSLANFYKIPASDILVVHDELDLPPGEVKLKFGGGIAGHRGLRDITAALGTPEFWRLRLGIGHPGERAEVLNFVLRAPPRDEADAIGAAIDRGLAVMPYLIDGATEKAMLKLHTKAQAQPAEPPAAPASPPRENT